MSEALALPIQLLPILQWASELPEDASELLADLAKIQAMTIPPLTPAVPIVTDAVTVIAGAYDRFPLAAIQPNAAQARVQAVCAKLEAHKLGDGTLLSTILKYLPTIISILQLFGVPVPTIPGLPTQPTA